MSTMSSIPPATAADRRVPESEEVSGELERRAAFRFYDRAAAISSLTVAEINGAPVKVTASAKVVAYALARHANVKTGQCNPSQKTLVIETGLSGRTVQEAVRLLVEIGKLSVTHGRGNRAAYELLEAGPDPRPLAGPDEGQKRETSRVQKRGSSRVQKRGSSRVPRGTANANGEGGTSEYSQRLDNPEPQQLSREPDAAQNQAPAVDEPQRLLGNYATYVSGFTERPEPREAPCDRRLATELLARLTFHQILRRLFWALREEWWGDKVDKRFARFAGAIDTIGDQMLENPLRECRWCKGAMVATAKQRQDLDRYGDDAIVACSKCDPASVVAA